MNACKVIFLIPVFFVPFICARYAVFINPVTDLCISAVCVEPQPFTGPIESCKRAHQALFNEVAEVLEDKGENVRIALGNVIYGIKKNDDENMSAFMVPRKALLFVDAIDTALFPPRLNEEYLKNLPQEGTVVVLTMPWHDSITKKNYSVGTRFVRTYADTSKHYGITLLDTRSQKKVVSRVPKNAARIESKITSYEEAQKEFVTRLYAHARLPHGVIPYVWGGSSFIYPQKEYNFFSDEQSRYWYKSKLPITGYDCSELVLRTAQICCLPYFYKVTAVISEYMRPLAEGEELTAGDLLWHPGHVMVVGDIAKNELIESRGYKSGHGKVQAVPLNALFPEVETYEDLKKKYFAKEPLAVNARDGFFYMTITEFKIFKLKSAWEHNSFI